jgi:hypothetical protein
MARKKLGEMFVEDGIIKKDDLKKVLQYQKDHCDMKFGEILLIMKLVDREKLFEYLKKQEQA